MTLPGNPESEVLYGDPIYEIPKPSWQSPERSFVTVRNQPQSGGFKLEGCPGESSVENETVWGVMQ